MTGKQSKQATIELMCKIVAECIEYATKDGLPLSSVMRTVGNGLLDLADKIDA